MRPTKIGIACVDNNLTSGPVVFLSKCLAMLPVIWTDDDAESDCKSYFNLYTFVVFLAWIGKRLHQDSLLSRTMLSWLGVAVISGFRVDLIESWPAAGNFSAGNLTSSERFMGRVRTDMIMFNVLYCNWFQMTVDTYLGCILSNAIIAAMFGIFKCTNFAEVCCSIEILLNVPFCVIF